MTEPNSLATASGIALTSGALPALLNSPKRYAQSFSNEVIAGLRNFRGSNSALLCVSTKPNWPVIFVNS